MNDEQPYYLFVYGTLRAGLNNSVRDRIVNDVEWIGNAEIIGRLYDIGNYPGAVRADDAESGCITGEVLKLRNAGKVLEILDEYEGINRDMPESSEYYRALGKVYSGGKEIKAWVYWYNLPVTGKERIQQNDYLEYLINKKFA